MGGGGDEYRQGINFDFDFNISAKKFFDYVY